MKFIHIVVVISIIAVGVLGFVFMDHKAGHNPMGCIAVATSKGECPQTSNLLEFILFHISALKHVSTAILFFAALSLLLAILGVIRVFPSFSVQPFFSTHRRQQKIYSESIAPHLKKHFIDWLSLHEKRGPDALLVGA